MNENKNTVRLAVSAEERQIIENAAIKEKLSISRYAREKIESEILAIDDYIDIDNVRDKSETKIAKISIGLSNEIKTKIEKIAKKYDIMPYKLMRYMLLHNVKTNDKFITTQQHTKMIDNEINEMQRKIEALQHEKRNIEIQEKRRIERIERLKKSAPCLKISTDYYIIGPKGKKYESLKELSEKENIPYNTLKKRLYKYPEGTPQDIIFYKSNRFKTFMINDINGNIKARSTYEAVVYSYLADTNIAFNTEWIPPKMNRNLRFDANIYNIGLIEIDGKQHFVQTNRTNIETIIESDKEKTKYCETNKIPLLRIRYDQVSDGSYEYLISDFISNSKQYITKHNILNNDEYYAERTITLRDIA